MDIYCTFASSDFLSVLQINTCPQDLREILQSIKNVLRETTILFRSNHQRCSIKKLFLKVSQYSQENTYVPWSLFLIKLQDFSPAALFKIDPNTGFLCEYCKILKSTYFEEHLRTATSAFFKSAL